MDAATIEDRWLSHAELAKARGISKRAAARLAYARGWERRADVDGTIRVAVPVSESARRPERTALDDKGDHIQDTTRPISFLAAVRELKEQLRREGTRADDAEKRAQAMAEHITDLKLAEALARGRAEALQLEVERLAALLGGGFWGRFRRFWRIRRG